jgi:6-methylsalicylate decarboxylase
VPAIDVHQHLWPEPFLAALARRRRPPRLVRHRHGWTLRTHGERESAVDLAAHDPDGRLALLDARGVDSAFVAPSTPLGIEALPPDESAPLLRAYHAGVAQLPSRLRSWAAVGLVEPDDGELAALLERGFVGACIAADALSDPEGYAALGPVLALLERRAAPLFVHPGPSPRTPRAGPVERLPAWWPAMTRYVAGMHVAWHAFGLIGRPAHPRLRVCFAMLAGLAPLHRERLVARGGRPRADSGTFLDTSSYGARAVDAVVREVGVDALVYGSDAPVIDQPAPALGDAVAHAVRERNPARLLASASEVAVA